MQVELTSAPETYRVRVTSEERSAEKEYTDAARDCQRRARVAAVFVFLTLLPPELWTEALVQDDAASETPQEAAAAPPPRRRGVRLEVAGLVESAWGRSEAPAVVSPGIELRSLLGRAQPSPFLSLGFAPEVDLDFPESSARLWRLPAGAGVQWEVPWERGWMALEAGLQAQAHGVRSTGVLHPRGDVVLRWGGRAGLRVGYALGDFVPFFAVHGTFFADRRSLLLEPRGEVGELPRWWVGASLGAGWQL